MIFWPCLSHFVVGSLFCLLIANFAFIIGWVLNKGSEHLGDFSLGIGIAFCMPPLLTISLFIINVLTYAIASISGWI